MKNIQQTKRRPQVTYVSVTERSVGQRLDNFLMAQLRGVPKSVVYRIIRKGEVRVNKKRARPDYKLKVLDEIRIPPLHTDPEPELPNPKLAQIAALESHIIYEDDALLIINKPSGLAVHGGSGLNFGLIEALRSLRPESSFLELVHRLDRETSGILLVAKKRSALRALHTQLREQTMDKRYLALVVGDWPSNKRKVTLSIDKRSLPNGERMMVASKEGKPSLTRFNRIESYNNEVTLVEATPVTGRTHQIRVHCQASGYPIVGDTKYGDEAFMAKEQSKHIKRLFLHASQLTFFHPKQKKEMTFVAPLSKELKKVLASFKS